VDDGVGGLGRGPVFVPVDQLPALTFGSIRVGPVAGRVDHLGDGTMFVVGLGRLQVEVDGGEVFPVPRAGYAVLASAATVRGHGAMWIRHEEHHGLFSVGGPVESTGRLRYIDGCSDTVLVAPVVRGDPCLNLLHLPAGTVQSDHDHPSLRVGLVLGGAGVCVLADQERADLQRGTVFVLPPATTHRFETDTSDLLIVAWHPDSDVGPTEDDHPMLNRTLRPGSQERVR
jgi:quercetin dioxygenase-like cupin family protein